MTLSSCPQTWPLSSGSPLSGVFVPMSTQTPHRCECGPYSSFSGPPYTLASLPVSWEGKKSPYMVDKPPMVRSWEGESFLGMFLGELRDRKRVRRRKKATTGAQGWSGASPKQLDCIWSPDILILVPDSPSIPCQLRGRT